MDFTAMTDAGILAFLRQQPHVSCGRFRPDQMNRRLTGVPASGVGAWQRWLAAVVAVFGLNVPRAFSQTEMNPRGGGPPQPTEQIPKSVDGDFAPSDKQPTTRSEEPQKQRTRPDTIIIQGRVRDYFGFPVPRARVQVEGMRASIAAGKDGRFRIAIPTTGLAERSSIRVFKFGFAMKEVAFSSKRSRKFLVLLHHRPTPISGKFR